MKKLKEMNQHITDCWNKKINWAESEKTMILLQRKLSNISLYKYCMH